MSDSVEIETSVLGLQVFKEHSAKSNEAIHLIENKIKKHEPLEMKEERKLEFILKSFLSGGKLTQILPTNFLLVGFILD